MSLDAQTPCAPTMRLTDLELPDDAPQITMQALKSVLRDNSPFYDLLSRTGPEEEK